MCQNNPVLLALHTAVLVEWVIVLLEYVDQFGNLSKSPWFLLILTYKMPAQWYRIIHLSNSLFIF